MSEVILHGSKFVKFFILSNIYGKVEMDNPPGGWRDDDLELDRSKEHGIFNVFSKELEFYRKYRDIIEETFQVEGNNSSVYLIKEETQDTDNGVMFVEIYRGRADWETKSIKNGILTIKFSSLDIEEKIKANATDEIEIETQTSLDDINIGEMPKYLTSLAGREISIRGRSVIDFDAIPPGNDSDRKYWYTPPTKLITQGYLRHTPALSSYATSFGSLDDEYYIENGGGFANYFGGGVAGSMFFIDVVETQATTFLTTGYKIKVVAKAPEVSRELQISICYKRKNEFSVGYSNVHREVLWQGIINTGQNTPIELEGSHTYEVPYDVGVVICYRWFSTNYSYQIPNISRYWLDFEYQELDITGYTYYEPSLDLSCIFVHDAFDRMIQILTSKKNIFYSKYFGRTELGYERDGEGGLIGLISGYWARAFNTESEKYKSPVFSWSKLLESTDATFAIGMGTEIVNGLKRVRIEKVKYFYQNQVVIKLGQVTNLQRDYDKSLYFSSVEIGYNKGGDYENEIGLDEPNTKTSFATPDRKSKNTYRKISDIRSDEYGLEITRRKPEFLYPDEDTRGDTHNWYLDLKRAFNGKFQQKDWQDRLQEEPTGVNTPETYRSFFFTPLRMLFRHGWILRAGLSTYLERKIKYLSSKANTNLRTLFIGETETFQENLPDGLKVNKLERSRFLPEKITFEHPVDDKLIKLIYGTTRVFYEGSWEDIPNYYFKWSFINEKQEEETGFIMNFKPTSLGKFEMKKANEKTI